MVDLPAALAEARKQAGFSQVALGEALGIASTHVSKIERREKDTRPEIVQRWLDLCGYDLVVIDRKAPAPQAVIAEFANLGPSDLAELRRLAGLLRRMDMRTRRMLSAFHATIEDEMADQLPRAAVR